ncbi:hypothetical protein H310_00253 [Aphanomyces invadans]|uniref:Small ribosomal subunit protein mS29 n=1 Tax=Aphanomyces invadans TaxID=157072 RepID=A0A024UTC7_9STRA|nr:hypothetical protein H310_00253 [Aphanomyces invadans]ETW09771.1 hypothetical protein H310_00253 [Aphanomyces invadans]|eukprot:XP_008861182.1 hypothetical protein H310_00253 [Aphanomyces invadans]
MLSKILSRRPARLLARTAASFSTEVPAVAAAAAAAPTGPVSTSVIAEHSIAQANKDTDVNKFFALTDEQIKKHFPSGLPKRIKEMFELVEPNKHFMLRKPVATILSAMSNFPESWPERWPEKAFVLDGERGTGKTVSLIQIVTFARENGWIVLHVPHARSWTHDAPYVTKAAYHEGKFDIDVVGADILKQLIQCHGDQLASLPLRGDYGDVYYPRTFIKKPKKASEYNKGDLTLLDICESGLKDELLTCKAVLDLKAELAEVTEFPVLIAIDEYNTWFHKTVFGYEGVPVKAEDITIVDAFRDVDATGYRVDRKLKNGLFIAATTENYPTKNEFSKQASYKRVRKLLHPYTPEELTSLVDYFHAINFRQSKYSEKDVVFLRLMSKGVPLKVFKQASVL